MLLLDPMSRFNPRLPICHLLSALIIALGTGCANSGSTRTTPSGPVSSGETTANPVVMERVERDHIIGPNAAREIDYRIAWQYVGNSRPVALFRVEGDSCFVLDDQNFLTRIKVQDGQRLWRMQVTGHIDQIVGINYAEDRVYVTAGGAVIVLDAGTGSQIAKQPIEQIANTQPTMHGGNLIYGSRNGQIVWHSGSIGYRWKSYQIANAVTVPPVVEDSLVAAVGSSGELMLLTATDARQIWSRKLLAPIIAKPVIGEEAVFVAGQDQYLTAFDLNDGRTIWKVLRERPLSDAPTLIGERLYQRIPGYGLACYVAMPYDKPGGELVWNSPNVDGNVIFERRNNLFVWNPRSRKLVIVDPNRGAVTRSLELPSAYDLQMGGEKFDEIYGVSDDGRVIRLVPRN